jgi:hypothetical protein
MVSTSGCYTFQTSDRVAITVFGGRLSSVSVSSELVDFVVSSRNNGECFQKWQRSLKKAPMWT